MTQGEVAEYNVDFLINDPAFNDTNAGWCHRYSPFRNFITNEDVIKFIQYFKSNYYNPATRQCEFNNALMELCCGKNYKKYYYTKALMHFINILCKETDKYGRIIKHPLEIANLYDDKDTIALSIQTYNKQLFETVGGILDFKYSSSLCPMTDFLSDVLSLLSDFACQWGSKSDNAYRHGKDDNHWFPVVHKVLPFAIYPNKATHMITATTSGHHYNVARRPDGSYQICGWGSSNPPTSLHDCLAPKNLCPSTDTYATAVVPLHINDLTQRGLNYHPVPGIMSGVDLATIRKLRKLKRYWLDYTNIKEKAIQGVQNYMNATKSWQRMFMACTRNDMNTFQNEQQMFNSATKAYWAKQKEVISLINKNPELKSLKDLLYLKNGLPATYNPERYLNIKEMPDKLII